MNSLIKKPNLRVKESWVGGTVSVNIGKGLVQQLISENMVGFCIGEFFLTKKLGSGIHLKKNRKLKKRG